MLQSIINSIALLESFAYIFSGHIFTVKWGVLDSFHAINSKIETPLIQTSSGAHPVSYLVGTRW